MATHIWPIDAIQPEMKLLKQAADLLRLGGLVAIPTETVYGLAAHALQPEAVLRIFEAKGRPATNPLIVHVIDQAAARPLVQDWPAIAETLAKQFWPGPLTFILPRSSMVPDVVTGGGPTVALRCPAHPVIHGLLRACGFPLAAPSANRSTRISPTRAEHVVKDLDDRIDAILDAGPCPYGLESTIVDLTCTPVRILRPGPIGAEALKPWIPVAPMAKHGPTLSVPRTPLRSPGMMPRHYAPQTPLIFISDAPTNWSKILEDVQRGRRIGILAMGSETTYPKLPNLIIESMPMEAPRYAACLYDCLHHLDAAGLDLICVESPPQTEEWRAVHDRLSRAAATEIPGQT